MGYSYVSVMYRLCVGYVSVMYRSILGARKEKGERRKVEGGNGKLIDKNYSKLNQKLTKTKSKINQNYYRLQQI